MASAALLAAKQSISYLLLTRWLALLFLFLPHSTLQDAHQELVCPCKRESAKELMEENVLHDSVTEGQTRMLWCCAHNLLKYNDPHFNITWSFKGEEYPWKQSSFETHPCGVEVLVTRGASLSDQGNYTCIITASDGTSITRSVDLSVHENKIYRDVPTDIHSTGDLIEPLGAKNVTFTCEGYVGDDQYFPFSWKQVNSKGNITFLNKLPNVTLLPPVGHEKLKSQFVISEVAEEHYGVYICTVMNSFGSETINMTLSKGVPEIIIREEKYRSLLMVATGALVLVGMCVFLWLRCGPQISLCLQHTLASPTSDDGQVDILVVHGDSATYWVGSVLLPVLEDTYHYKCFLPQRDMLAGDLILEEVATRVWRCNCVLVVVTPCLLQCSWAAWALHHALQASLTTNIRLISLKLQNFKPNDPCLSDPYDIVKSLKPVRSLRVPKSCGLQMLVVKEETPDDDTTNSLPGQNGRKRERDTESLAGRNTSLPDENKRGEDKNVNSKGSWWGNKEKRVKATSKIDKKKEIRDISQERDKAEHWKLERQERRSRLEVPSSSSSKIRSRSRSRSKSPMECTWRLIEEEQIQEENIFTSDLGKMSRVKQDKIQRTTNERQYNNNNTTPDAVESPRTQLKLNLSELIQPHYMSGSPGSQRLSNMVSASRAASRESLEPDENTTAIEKHRHLTQEYQDDLDSPSSITRFILTPPQHPSPSWRTRSICESLSLVFTSDAELVFWHTLLYRLGPPSTTPLQV